MTLNLLYELINYKMRGLFSILLLFCNGVKKFDNTGAQMLEIIYHLTLELFEITFLSANHRILPHINNVVMGVMLCHYQNM